MTATKAMVLCGADSLLLGGHAVIVSPMDHCTARQILRLSRLEERARAHSNNEWRRANVARLMRAARFEEAVAARASAIAMSEVTTFQN
jgi:hypothetical protein